MNIHSLTVYPVKSLAGVAVDSLTLDDFGPAGDRRWMIVDSGHQFVTQRANPGVTGPWCTQLTMSRLCQAW